MTNNINFISNNVRRVQYTNKRFKLLKYLKQHVSKGFSFLQETHSTLSDDINWKYDFKSEVFHSYGKSNPYGVLICFMGSTKISLGI